MPAEVTLIHFEAQSTICTSGDIPGIDTHKFGDGSDAAPSRFNYRGVEIEEQNW